jgi:hypothetical protein
MCTVTFIPVRGNYFITSSRDENPAREAASAPSLQVVMGKKMIFPRDERAGGTWIALKENGDAAVLLNGAFIKHVPQLPYRKSRGLLLPEILSDDYPSLRFFKMNLQGIEPFTLILFEKKSLFEFRWDGFEKFGKQLPAYRPHIWSSSTLYDGLVIKKRENWFLSFLNRVANPTQLDIINFHRNGGDEDIRNNIRMNRDGKICTMSITGIHLTDDCGFMKYLDLAFDKTSEIKLCLTGNSTSVW